MVLTIQEHCFYSFIHCLQLPHCFVGDQAEVTRVPQHVKGYNNNLDVLTHTHSQTGSSGVIKVKQITFHYRSVFIIPHLPNG